MLFCVFCSCTLRLVEPWRRQRITSMLPHQQTAEREVGGAAGEGSGWLRHCGRRAVCARMYIYERAAGRLLVRAHAGGLGALIDCLLQTLYSAFACVLSVSRWLGAGERWQRWLSCPCAV